MSDMGIPITVPSAYLAAPPNYQAALDSCLNPICGAPYGCQRKNCRVLSPPPASQEFPLAEQMRADIAAAQAIVAGAATTEEMARRMHVAGRMERDTLECILEDR